MREAVEPVGVVDPAERDRRGDACPARRRRRVDDDGRVAGVSGLRRRLQRVRRRLLLGDAQQLDGAGDEDGQAARHREQQQRPGLHGRSRYGSYGRSVACAYIVSGDGLRDLGKRLHASVRELDDQRLQDRFHGWTSPRCAT